MNAAKANSIRMEFEDNGVLALLSGEHNQHLAHIEKSLDVTLDSFGNSIKISGAGKATKTARTVIEDLYRRIADGKRDDIDKSMVEDALRWAVNGHQADAVTAGESFDTWKKKIVAKTKGQNDYLKLLRSNEVVFGLGPAGEMVKFIFLGKISIQRTLAALNPRLHLRQLVIGLRADHQINHGLPPNNFGPLRLSHAAGNTNFQAWLCGFQPAKFTQFRIDLLGGFFTNMAGIEQDHICIIRRIGLHIALRTKGFGHPLAVIDVHLTAICLDIQLFRIGHGQFLFGKACVRR